MQIMRCFQPVPGGHFADDRQKEYPVVSKRFKAVLLVY